MVIKIANEPEEAQSVTWRQISNRTAVAKPKLPTAPGVSAAEADELKQRLAQLEQAKQAEVARARQEGQQQGVKQARDEAAGQTKANADKLAQTLADLLRFKHRLRADAEMELVNLSLAIARRVLHRELATDAHALQGVVHAALQRVQSREVWKVRVYPAAADAVRAALEAVGRGSAQVIPDPALKDGDLLIETSMGEIDASIDSQLREIQRGFADRLALP